jgi:hypothetical protein
VLHIIHVDPDSAHNVPVKANVPCAPCAPCAPRAHNHKRVRGRGCHRSGSGHGLLLSRCLSGESCWLLWQVFRWHRRLLLTAEPDNIKKTSEPGSTVLTPITAAGKHQPFSSYVYTNKLLLRQTIPGYNGHHLVICTHCNRVAKPLSETATGLDRPPKTLRETVGQWVKPAGTTTSSHMLQHLRNVHGLPASDTEEDRIRADHGLLVGKKRKAHEIDPQERDTAMLGDRSEAWKLRKKDEPFRPDVSRKLLAIAKAATNAPSTMVENPHWINFFRYNQPEFPVISHQTWDRDVEDLYRKEKGRVKGELVRHLNRSGKLCLTFDGWSSNR